MSSLYVVIRCDLVSMQSSVFVKRQIFQRWWLWLDHFNEWIRDYFVIGAYVQTSIKLDRIKYSLAIISYSHLLSYSKSCQWWGFPRWSWSLWYSLPSMSNLKGCSTQRLQVCRNWVRNWTRKLRPVFKWRQCVSVPKNSTWMASLPPVTVIRQLAEDIAQLIPTCSNLRIPLIGQVANVVSSGLKLKTNAKKHCQCAYERYVHDQVESCKGTSLYDPIKVVREMSKNLGCETNGQDKDQTNGSK